MVRGMLAVALLASAVTVRGQTNVFNMAVRSAVVIRGRALQACRS